MIHGSSVVSSPVSVPAVPVCSVVVPRAGEPSSSSLPQATGMSRRKSALSTAASLVLVGDIIVLPQTLVGGSWPGKT